MNKIKNMGEEKNNEITIEIFLHNGEDEMHPKTQDSVSEWITCKAKWIESLYSIVCLVMITSQLPLLLLVEHM